MGIPLFLLLPELCSPRADPHSTIGVSTNDKYNEHILITMGNCEARAH